jgi:hypothetical protein
MERFVIAVAHNRQVLQPIVGAGTVDVVDNMIIGDQPVMPLPDESMHLMGMSTNRHNMITLPVDCAAPLLPVAPLAPIIRVGAAAAPNSPTYCSTSYATSPFGFIESFKMFKLLSLPLFPIGLFLRLFPRQLFNTLSLQHALAAFTDMLPMFCRESLAQMGSAHLLACLCAVNMTQHTHSVSSIQHSYCFVGNSSGKHDGT